MDAAWTMPCMAFDMVDQIYSVDFGKDGSQLKRFSSEKPREAQNLEKMYLGGVFNGVPKYEYNIK